MKYLLIVFSSLFLFSCSPSLNKALNVVVSATDFTPTQEQLLATKCASKFPIQETTTEGKPDTNATAYKQAYEDIKKQYVEAATDFETAMADVEEKKKRVANLEASNADLLAAVAKSDSARSRKDRLGGAKDAYETLPAIEITKLNTVIKKQTADLRNSELNLAEANKTIALQRQDNELQRQAHEKQFQELRTQLEKCNDRASNRFWYGVLCGAGAIIGLVCLLKFGFKLF